jgi:hypothetical protein
VVICEKNSTNAYGNQVLLDVYPMMKGDKKKIENNLLEVASKGKKRFTTTYNLAT